MQIPFIYSEQKRHMKICYLFAALKHVKLSYKILSEECLEPSLTFSHFCKYPPCYMFGSVLNTRLSIAMSSEKKLN